LALTVLEKEGKLPKGPKSQVFGELRDKLEVKRGSDGTSNGGNAATLGMKHLSRFSFFMAISPDQLISDIVKIGRQNGVHVTVSIPYEGLYEADLSSQPTVLFDGLKEDSVSSSWGSSEWDKFLS
jgi:hypothetical protein